MSDSLSFIKSEGSNLQMIPDDSTVLTSTFTKKTLLETTIDESIPSSPASNSLNSNKPTVSKDFIATSEDDPDIDFERITEATSLKVNEEIQNSVGDNYLTLTGTLKRGKKAGQNVDVKVNITKEELKQLEIARAKGGPAHTFCQLNLLHGPHILIFSLFVSPIVFLLAFIYSFYLGTITWHNVLSLYTEEKPFYCRILSAPLLILAYPFLIILTTFGVGVFAAICQISWSWHLWLSEVQDLEKGFYAGLCSVLGLEVCSPYTEVVITNQANQEP